MNRDANRLRAAQGSFFGDVLAGIVLAYALA
jgi:hypothetical protein